jgi:putative ABC transport system permease protein
MRTDLALLWRRFADAFRENVAVAFDSLRVSKLRSALTILGVVIGVATVMAMASIVQGIQQQIVDTIKIAGPTTFYVMKVFSQTPLNPQDLPQWVRDRPDLTVQEAERIRALPGIAYAGMWGQYIARVEYAGVRTQPQAIVGADAHYTEIQGGSLTAGRWFTQAEETNGAAVAVLDVDVAEKLFGSIDPLGKLVHIGARPARVIGIYQPAANIFSPPGQQIMAIVPYLMLDHQFTLDKTNMVFIPVKPRAGVSLDEAQSEVIVALRQARGLRPSQHNTFDLLTQDQILDVFNKLTGVFFLVMIVLSGVALMVGGIGVMAVMMISVTERTHEIGLRKAVGATRSDILQQFLVEAATLTGIGGAVGIVIGLGLGRIATLAMKINAAAPLRLTVVAVAVSVAIGLLFGVLPAQRAARLDPVEALRYE